MNLCCMDKIEVFTISAFWKKQRSKDIKYHSFEGVNENSKTSLDSFDLKFRYLTTPLADLRKDDSKCSISNVALPKVTI